MTAPRRFVVPNGHQVAEVDVPVDLAREIQRLFEVKNLRVAQARVWTVMQHPPVPGRWGHETPWHSCECEVPSCGHIRAVLAFLGGPASAPVPPAAA